MSELKTPGDPPDIAEVKDKVGKVSVWWERARVTILGLSIVIAVLSATYVLGSTQSTILEKLASVVESINDVRSDVKKLADDQKEFTASLSNITERTGKLEAKEEARAESTRLFWSKDWPTILNRIEMIERDLFHRKEFWQRSPER